MQIRNYISTAKVIVTINLQTLKYVHLHKLKSAILVRSCICFESQHVVFLIHPREHGALLVAEQVLHQALLTEQAAKEFVHKGLPVENATVHNAAGRDGEEILLVLLGLELLELILLRFVLANLS